MGTKKRLVFDREGLFVEGDEIDEGLAALLGEFVNRVESVLGGLAPPEFVLKFEKVKIRILRKDDVYEAEIEFAEP